MRKDRGHFYRPELVQKFADDITGQNPFSDSSNGLFLSGPRRTGKTSFLRNELMPALSNYGYLVLYCDMMNEPGYDAFNAFKVAVSRTADAIGLSGLIGAGGMGFNEIKVPSVGTIDPKLIAAIDFRTVETALSDLRRKVSKDIVLVIDEAQLAMTHHNGNAFMAGLKSARDQMRSDGQQHLLLIMTGSDRDKLMRLVTSKNAAFYGSQVQEFPLLDERYIDFVCKLAEDFTKVQMLDRNKMARAFELFEHEPQTFKSALSTILSKRALGSETVVRIETQMVDMAIAQRLALIERFQNTVKALPPLQQAIVTLVAEKGENFEPYTQVSLDYYTRATGEVVTPSRVQKALDKLRADDSAILWKSHQGQYALQEGAMARWMREGRPDEISRSGRLSKRT